MVILSGMTSAFAVLAEPNRRRILDLLRERERPVGELVEALSASQPAVSKHLRVLREAGVVEARVDAQRRLYRVRPEPLRELDAWLEALSRDVVRDRPAELSYCGSTSTENATSRNAFSLAAFSTATPTASTA